MNLCLKCGRLYDDDIERCPKDGEELLPYEATTHDGEEVAGVVLGRVLGVGPCGKILDGIEVESGQHVVVRLLGEELLRDRPAADALRRHLLSAKAFGHPGAVHVRSVTAQDDRVVVVRDVVDGERLEDLLARETALPVERALPIAIRVSKVLAAAHRTGLLHLQIRASNVFLVPEADQEESVRLVDFGIGPLVRAGTRWIHGAPHSLAPEQIDLKLQPSAKTDVFAVGLLVFHMLTGRTAYPRAGDPSQTVSQPLPPLRAPDGSTFPPPLDALVRALADRKPPLRPTNMDAVCDRLHRLLPGGQVRASRPPLEERRGPAKPLPVPETPAAHRPKTPSAHLDEDEPEDLATMVMSETAMAAAIAEGMTFPPPKPQKPAVPKAESPAPSGSASSPASPKGALAAPAPGGRPKAAAGKAGLSIQIKIGIGAAVGVVVLGLLAILVPLLASGPAPVPAKDVASALAPADVEEAGLRTMDAFVAEEAEPKDAAAEAAASEAAASEAAATEAAASEASAAAEEVPQAPSEPDSSVEAVADASAPQVAAAADATDKEQLEWYVTLGNRALAERRFDEAQEQFAKALAIDAQDRASRLGMGRTAAQQGRFDTAVTYLEPLLRARGSVELGMAYVRLDRLDDAKEQFALVLARDPSNAEAARALESVGGGSAP